MWNNGKGIPVVMHEEQKMFIPELVFGTLITSDVSSGFGAKLTNIFSKKFEIVCADINQQKLLKQTYRSNMTIKDEPIITDLTKDAINYTEVTFEPDFEKFSMKSLDDGMLSLLKKRVYDIAGCYPNISVNLNE